MNITVNSQLLAQELRLMSKITPNKPALPILSHVLLRTTDGTTHFYATNLELGLQTQCPAATTPGQVALPAAKLLAMVEQFPNADVSIDADEKKATITCGAFTSRIQALSATDFPAVPEVEGVECKIDARGLKQMLERTRHAVSETESKILLRGALLRLTANNDGDSGVAALIATDGRRLALASMPYDGPTMQMVIPAKTMDMLLQQLEVGIVTAVRSDRHLFFITGNRTLISRQIEGEFPKFERVMPTSNTLAAKVDNLKLAAAIRRVSLAAGEDAAMDLRFTPNQLTLTSLSSEVGDASEHVPVVYDGDELTICLNWSHLLDFLTACSTLDITLAMKDAKTAILMTSGEDYVGVSMPLVRGA